MRKKFLESQDAYWKECPKGKRKLPVISPTNLEVTLARDIGVFQGATLEMKIAQALAYRRRRIEADHDIAVEDETERFRSIPPPPEPTSTTNTALPAWREPGKV
jgi:hypothetical protein